MPWLIGHESLVYVPQAMASCLFLVTKSCNVSPECQAFLNLLMTKANWKVKDTLFKNTPLLWAISQGNEHSIQPMIHYLSNHPELLPMLLEPNQGPDSNNTPLILAIKNGDVGTALSLIEYYDKKHLMHTSSYGNTALHLAAYCGFDVVITALLKQAEKIGCKEEVLTQLNNKRIVCNTVVERQGYTAYDLYKEPFPHEYGQYLFFNQRASSAKIGNYNEEIGKHLFGEMLEVAMPTKTINREIEALLRVESPLQLVPRF